MATGLMPRGDCAEESVVFAQRYNQQAKNSGLNVGARDGIIELCQVGDVDKTAVQQ